MAYPAVRFFKRYGWLLLIVLGAFALRAYRLDFFSLRGDESFTVLFVQKPLAQMWQETLTIEPNPPLLYFLLRGWIALAGESEFATRFFSLFFGVLCVPLAYRLARVVTSTSSRVAVSSALTSSRQSATPPPLPQSVTRETVPSESAQSPNPSLTGRVEQVALVAAFVMALNPYQIWHSQDVRNYTLWPALSLLTLVFFWKWYARRDNALGLTRQTAYEVYPLLWFVVAELAALYAHYYEAFLVLALNLFVLATLWRDRQKIARWLGAQIVLALLYLPYPLLLSNRVSSYGEGSGRQGVALWDIARETFSIFMLSDTLDENLRAWLWIPFALVALAGLIYLFRSDWKRGLFFLLYAGVPTLAVFALNIIRPLYLERYLNGIAPSYYLLLAFGIVELTDSRFAFDISSLTSRFSSFVLRPSSFVSHPSSSLPRPLSFVLRLSFLAAIALTAFVALANYWTNPAYAKAPDWRGLANLIHTRAQRGDIIVQNFPETSLVYYDRRNLPLVVYPETFLPDGATDRALNALNANYQRVWFIPAAPDFWDPDQFVETWLDHRDDLLNEWKVGDLPLRLYGTPSQYLNNMKQVGANFGDTLTLSGYRLDLETEPARLVLYWRAQKTPGQDLNVRIGFPNATGGYDAFEVPVRGAYPTSRWRKNELVVDQHDLPPEVLHVPELHVSVCDGKGETCLPLQVNSKPNQGNELLIPVAP